MATRQMKIVITVKDGASKKMNQVDRSFKKTQKTVDDFDKRLVNFNRTLFSTTALAGTLAGVFMGIGRAINKGADFSRTEESFKRIFGPGADILKDLGKFTDVAVDEVAAMRAAIRLSMNDIGLGSKQITEVLAMGAVAAKKANVDTAEGVRLVTEAVRSGNIEALDNLNIINKGGTAFQAYEAAIRKAAGTMGPAALALKRKAEAIKLLRRETRDYMFGTRDLKDQVITLTNYVTRATARFGEFLGKALSPVMSRLAGAAEAAGDFFDRLKDNKSVLEMTKRIITASAAVGGLLVTLASLKLAVIGLTLVTTGIPGLAAAVAAGAAIFLGFNTTINSVVSGLKTLGKMITGVWQIVSRFDESTGLTSLDKSIAELFVKFGLLEKRVDATGKVFYDGFILQIGRGLIVARAFFQGFRKGAKDAFTYITSQIKSITVAINKFLGLKSGPWANSWITSFKSFGEFAGKYILPLIGGLVALKGIKGMVGGLFGGGGKGPKGTMTDPIYTVSTAGALGGAGKLLGKIPGVSRLGNLLSNFMNRFILSSKILGEIFTNPAGKMAGIRTLIFNAMKAGGRFLLNMVKLGAGFIFTALKMGGGLLLRGLGALAPLLGPALAVAAAGAVGVAIGKVIEPIVNRLLNKFTTDTTDEGFEGNIVERGMFKLDKYTGLLGGHAQKFVQNQKKIDELNEQDRQRRLKEGTSPVIDLEAERKKREGVSSSLNKGKKSQVTMPRVYKDELAKVDEMAMDIMGMKGEEQMQAKEAMQAALSESSEGGAAITEKEMMKFRQLVEALNSSEMNKNIRTMTEEMRSTSMVGSRRK